MQQPVENPTKSGVETQKTINDIQPVQVEQVENIDPAQMDETPAQEGVVFQGSGQSISEKTKQMEELFEGQERKSIWDYN